jgi:ABC-type transport system involved in multi-copper enzyme maturation permease subunit
MNAAVEGRQLLRLAGLAARRTINARRSLLVYLVAALPLFVAVPMAVFLPSEFWLAEGRGAEQFAEMFQFILRFVLLFGCAGMFINVFRGEILDRSLHFSLLLPVRREVLTAGKYLGTLVAALVVFGGSAVATIFVLHVRTGVGRAFGFVFGRGLGQVLIYLGVITLACAAYGALFLVVGMVFRNPMVPALAVFGWETINPILPPLLKRLSVLHHALGLCPVPVDTGGIALLADPTPGWLSVLGLLAASAALVALAAWLARRLEISYTAE